jgi:hypothetical protein
MNYSELIRLYFERSSALQWYWTLYVVIIGGLLAFSSLRKQPDLVTAVLVTVLYCLFAYKNLGAIGETSAQRQAVLDSMHQYPDTSDLRSIRERIEPTLTSTAWEGTRNFHIASDLFTLAAVWAMEWRRWRYREKRVTPSA